MTLEQDKKAKHWADRLIGYLCIVAIVAIVVSDNMLQMWKVPPPNWLYIGLAAVGAGVTTDEAKDFLLTFLRTWAGKGGKP